MAVIENKVTGAVVGASSFTVVANFVLWLLARYVDTNAATEPSVVGFVNFVVAGVGAFVVGYASRHTHREELPPEDGGLKGTFGDVDPPGFTL